jgi:hypothetical protein
MSERLNQANRILDRTCKQAGMDPVETRIAMINAIKDRQVSGSGFTRQGAMAQDTLISRKQSGGFVE